MRLKVPDWLNIDAEKFRKHYKHLQQQVEEMEEFARRYQISLPPTLGEGGTPPLTERFKDMTIRNAAAKALEEVGGPLHLSDLLEVLLEGGAEIGGDNPANTLRGTIYGDKRFEKAGRNVWQLAATTDPSHGGDDEEDKGGLEPRGQL